MHKTNCQRWHVNRAGARIVALAAVFGSIQIASAQAPAKAGEEVTFAKDIAPLLQRSCQACHRPGQIGPMSLLTYQDVRPWARSIKQQTSQRNMPPWYIDKTVGIKKFKNDVSLSDAEIAMISKWVDAGAPLGNPTDMPPARKWDDSDRWHIGQPDIIVNLKRELLVKAKQPDQWLDIDTKDLGLTSDRYIQAIEIKPIKGTKVVHHVESTLIDPDVDGPAGRQHFEEYAVGKYGDFFPEGTGMLLKKGSTISANLHLHADGEDTMADVAFGIKLLPEGVVPKHVAHAQQLGMPESSDFDITPNTKNVRVDGYTTLTKPAVITSFQPHMHNRGQAQCLELIFPLSTNERLAGAKTQTASCVDRFKFDWHVVYEYDDDVAPIVPAGTILHVISLYDNTSGNRSNPDPSNWVGWGNRTVDEMGFSWIGWYNITEEEYKQAIAARQAKAKKTIAAIVSPK